MDDLKTFYEVRSIFRLFSKYAVALHGVSLLSEGDSLLIDAGTSLTPIAKIIRTLADVHPDDTHYTIMTHNNEAFLSLSDAPPSARFNVFQTGGRYDRDLNASFGHQAEIAYQKFYPKWVFIGQNGLQADLGLFCHGNTEELALKREIFAMPAWGRVIIADFTKIGTPGGLLFGDSSNLTTNVDQCWIISDDMHDEKFKHMYHTQTERAEALEKFEAQVRSLQGMYRAHVSLVHYSVFVGKLPLGDREENHRFESEPARWVSDKTEFKADPDKWLKENLAATRVSAETGGGYGLVVRVQITKDDVRTLGDDGARSRVPEPAVDLVITRSKDGSKEVVKLAVASVSIPRTITKEASSSAAGGAIC